MSGFARMLAADRGEEAIPLVPVSEAGFADFQRAWLDDSGRTLARAAGFRARQNQALLLPRAGGGFVAVVGLGKEGAGRWTLAAAIPALAEGRYRLEGPCPPLLLHGWLMAQHRFERYRKADDERDTRTLLVADPAAIDTAIGEAEAAALVRDLIDTPADDMGPDELEARIAAFAATHGGRIEVVRGDALLAQNFPAIHAVGRASPRQPRLIAVEVGQPQHPLVAIVGKGVCFDSGGLDLKPSSGMRLMKKDMGGAAHALALAGLLAGRRLPIRLRLVVAAVDNAVSGGALRPGDVIATRKGISVEVGNTDAEGRLILADALARAAEAAPALIVDFATLTGAARVALGPDLPAMFANDDDLAGQLLEAGAATDDPAWRLPLHEPYYRLLRSTIAGLSNVSEGGFAGSILAALFLKRFVPETTPWAHFDIYGWNPDALPGRPKGGAAAALFAVARAIEQRFG